MRPIIKGLKQPYLKASLISGQQKDRLGLKMPGESSSRRSPAAAITVTRPAGSGGRTAAHKTRILACSSDNLCKCRITRNGLRFTKTSCSDDCLMFQGSLSLKSPLELLANACNKLETDMMAHNKPGSENRKPGHNGGASRPGQESGSPGLNLARGQPGPASQPGQGSAGSSPPPAPASSHLPQVIIRNRTFELDSFHVAKNFKI